MHHNGLKSQTPPKLTIIGHAANQELLDAALGVLGHHRDGGVQLLGTLADDGADLRHQRQHIVLSMALGRGLARGRL